MASIFRPGVQKDAKVFESKGNVIKVKWVQAQNGSCPENSYKISTSQVVTCVIALDKNDSGNWILRSFVPGSPANSSQIMFLAVDEKLVTWKQCENGLPPGSIRSEKAGQHGNMYVARRKDTGEIGMVTRPDPRTCAFYTHDNEQLYSEGFEVLCAAS